jgi:hypothetical protein
MPRRDPLAWVGNRPPWAVRERKRILGRALITGLLITAALIYGITG